MYFNFLIAFKDTVNLSGSTQKKNNIIFLQDVFLKKCLWLYLYFKERHFPVLYIAIIIWIIFSHIFCQVSYSFPFVLPSFFILIFFCFNLNLYFLCASNPLSSKSRSDYSLPSSYSVLFISFDIILKKCIFKTKT